MLDAISMRESNSTLMRADLLDQVDASPKDGLATRELAPGDKPSLQDLAKAYGASRPTQQAFTQLVSEGIVEVERHLAHFVKPLTVPGGNEGLRASYRRLNVNALMARVLSGDLDSSTDVGAEHVELVAEGDLQRVGAEIRLHVEAGKRLARGAAEQVEGFL
jgi:DNA-binding transcriptional regulator YhcF (GntR family)